MHMSRSSSLSGMVRRAAPRRVLSGLRVCCAARRIQTERAPRGRKSAPRRTEDSCGVVLLVPNSERAQLCAGTSALRGRRTDRARPTVPLQSLETATHSTRETHVIRANLCSVNARPTDPLTFERVRAHRHPLKLASCPCKALPGLYAQGKPQGYTAFLTHLAPRQALLWLGSNREAVLRRCTPCQLRSQGA